MLGLNDVSGYIYQWIITPMFWLVLLVGFVILVFFFLIVRKRRRLKFPTIEVTEYGINNLKVGWFGLNQYFKGLWWSGREVMRTKEGEIVEGFSEDDFTEIDGKRGVLIYRDPFTKRLFPISNLKVDAESRRITAQVPPREFIDTAVEIIKETEKETKDRMEKVIQFLAWAFVIAFSLIAIIVITQMVKSGQKEAGDLVTKSIEICRDYGKQACQEIIQKPQSP